MNPRAVLLALISVPTILLASSPPATPVVIEPSHDGQIVNGADVHMVTAPFSDPDGDGHRCSDWQILSIGLQIDDVVWSASCVEGSLAIHIHLGDGAFGGSLSGKSELAPSADYRLRVRHRDDSGDPATDWSEWAERTFRTSDPLPAAPMTLRDVLSNPSPRWSVGEAPVLLPAGALLRLETPDEATILEVRSGSIDLGQTLSTRSAVRVVLQAGDEDWTLPESELAFDDQKGDAHTIYFPAVTIAAHEATRYWVSANGGTHVALEEERAPDFTMIARGAPVPWSVRQRGFRVDRFATGFRLPVNIAFVPHPGDAPESPLFYVTELYGTIKVVTRSGEVEDFATGLLDFDPTGLIPGSGESGLAGLTIDPESGDLFATVVSWPDHRIRELVPKVIRLHPSADGLRAESVESVVTFLAEVQSPSHQISNITIGPDRKLYVHLGDSTHQELSQDLGTVRGKILRMNFDGSPAQDNPFYDVHDDIGAKDYIFAYGFRNPFGGAWRAADSKLYEVENGPAVDRLARVDAGTNYGWDGTDDSMRIHALVNWDAPTAPVQIAFVQKETQGGSELPPEKLGNAYVSESGATWSTGVQRLGKRISEVVLGRGGVAHAPRPLVEYDGTGKATATALAAGPDGLYFADLYRDYGYATPIDRGANVFRIRWVGYADFDPRTISADGRTIDFIDRSIVPDATSWSVFFTWDFGDGTSSLEKSPRHRFLAEDTYIVRLSVTGPRGTVIETKQIFAGASDSSLSAEYFSGSDLDGDRVERTDDAIDFDWGFAAPLDTFVAGPFSVRWRGTIVPVYSETFRFTARTSDRIRVMIDGASLIDAWETPPSGEATASIELEAGRSYDLVVEYSHTEGPASIQLLWQSDTQPPLVVPRAVVRGRRRGA